jgi:hypothetical protein
MGGKASAVKVVFMDHIAVAVLQDTTEPVSWLTRNSYVLLGDVRFEPRVITVPVRHLLSGMTSLAKIVTMDLE